jgi:hypothetical protein
MARFASVCCNAALDSLKTHCANLRLGLQGGIIRQLRRAAKSMQGNLHVDEHIHSDHATATRDVMCIGVVACLHCASTHRLWRRRW